MKKRGALFYLLSLSIIIDIDIDRADFDTPQTRMVERFLKLNTTEKWGLHNRKVGFAQPKSGVYILGDFFETQPKSGVFTTIFIKWLCY